MKKIYSCLLAFGALLLCSVTSFATHIRAGEIIAVRENRDGTPANLTLTYKFTLVLYTDDSSPVPAGGGKINFGDGTGEFDLNDVAEITTKVRLGENISLNTFIFYHTYPNTQEFRITYREFNRNPLSRTMLLSIQTPFFIETKFIIDPFFGLNSTPILLVPPIDKAAVGATFLHNPGAFDLDGDSLSYTLVQNKQDLDVPVNVFKFPNDPSLYEGLDYKISNQAGDGPPTFTLDPITGDLVWDAPGIEGEYNIAFIVEEWRNVNGEWLSLGYVTRDMQIRVEKTDNTPPELTLPKDTCVVAGSLLLEQITADDADGHEVRIETFSGLYEISSSPATFSPDPPVYKPVIAVMDFSWQTNGAHVRERPYQVQFKATDAPPLGPALVDIQTWSITVVGPAPENLSATVNTGRKVTLNWDAYKYRNNASKMQVYRRVDSYEFDAENCQTGIPDFAGYQLVSQVDINNNSFVDDNDGKGLMPGVSYCYRLVATWPLPGGGESYASEEFCVEMEVTVPLITNVSVENTSNNNGEIFVKWTSPFELNQDLFPPPYRYDLLRSIGLTGKNDLTLVTSTADTTFTDVGLNTLTHAYNYRIVLYDANDNMVDTSSVASSVRLEAGSLLGAIELSWRAEVPWSNNIQENPYHLIYRDNGEGGPLQLIDSVNVNSNGFIYLDAGQYNGEPLSDAKEYCYFVETRGSYGHPNVLSPLFNKSQITCAQPNDTIPPCTPVLSIELSDLQDCKEFLADKECGFSNFFNTISWTDLTEDACGEDIRRYIVYFSPTGDEGTYTVVSPADLSETTFTHRNLRSRAGCYRIKSVDRSGNESEFSESICIDNCPEYELPNVITPNGDGKNDTFRPMDCPRFVESINFRVVNRWGKEIYSFRSNGENSIYIDWNGKTNQGDDVPAGVYYYVAEVTFMRLNPADKVQILKGYVHVLR
ncbi:MAG: gliding motility-associated C-terminal domain-containing protein [Bacteroidota bacterium]|nr:gliding motility-associated C-terminal domain-containing protein [Bacteroidota bacterium]